VQGVSHPGGRGGKVVGVQEAVELVRLLDVTGSEATGPTNLYRPFPMIFGRLLSRHPAEWSPRRAPG
jgi:hypothetical protein